MMTVLKTNMRVRIEFDFISGADITKTKSGEYVVWSCMENENVCDYCAVLDCKRVRARDMPGLSYPPAHVDCRCKLITVEQRYGEAKPVIYYYQLPHNYATWVREGKQHFKPVRVPLLQTMP